MRRRGELERQVSERRRTCRLVRPSSARRREKKQFLLIAPPRRLRSAISGNLDARSAGRITRDVNLVASRFVRNICDPTPGWGKNRLNLIELRRRKWHH